MASIDFEKLTLSPRKQPRQPGTNFAQYGLRDTYSLLRTAIPFMENDRHEVKTNISYAQSEGRLIDQEIAHKQDRLNKLLPDARSWSENAVKVDHESVRVQQSIEELLSRRRALRRFEDVEKGLLAPVRILPADILRHIFLPGHTGSMVLTGTQNDLSVFPRIVSQVCSYWRSVSHSCGALWSNIQFSIFDPDNVINSIPTYGQLIEDCVRFSNGMPMTLHLLDQLTPKILGDTCVRALGRCAHRWNDVLLCEEDLVTAVFASVPNDLSMECLEVLELRDIPAGTLSIPAAPKLKHLSIEGSEYFMDDYDLSQIHIAIESSPSLVQVNVGNVYSPLLALPGLNWVNVTEFTSNENYFQADELIRILERMPNLVSFTFYGKTWTTGNRHIEMPSLETLMTGGFTGIDIFNILVAPHLNNISKTACDLQVLVRTCTGLFGLAQVKQVRKSQARKYIWLVRKFRLG